MLNALTFKPLNVSYLYDNNGMFRGMAFVKYKEIDHGRKAFEAMNGLDINGRKLRIEYKRKVQEAVATQEDDVDTLYDQLVNFTSSQLNELSFPCVSSFQVFLERICKSILIMNFNSESKSTSLQRD
jgi:RNA recognition motif-containing protein